MTWRELGPLAFDLEAAERMAQCAEQRALTIGLLPL